MSLPARGPRLWLLRLAAVVLVPAAALLLLEAGLRLAGAGYPSDFLVPVEDGDAQGETLTSNPRFTERFFPPRLARSPVPFELAAPKPEGVYRVFVVGGSAARGTPEPAFGLPRVLESRLRALYPGGRFEVVNAAVTAVNSHVALPIVRDIVRRGEADLVVVYLGNNEVVGPFGAAAVLGDFSPRLGVIRAGLAVRGWRLGQVGASLLQAEPPRGGWRGMEMFLEQRLAEDDPRLEKVYRHFRRNLEDLVDAARDGGAGVVLSTVAVNLRDQPPFASLEDQALPAGDKARFEDELASGLAALAVDRAAALGHFESAVALDPGHAEAHYHRGRALLALGRGGEAREALERARDLDALRFRADTRINQTLREVAEERGVPLVDAAARLASSGPPASGEQPPIPGHDLFLEHVHLNFEGTAALAALVAEALAEVLPASSTADRRPAPAPAQLAESLPFTPEDALAVEGAILDIVSRPPFTATHGHLEDLRRRHRQLATLRRLVLRPAIRDRTDELYRRHLEEHPDDLLARRRQAEILGRRGDAEGALEAWTELTDRLPGVAAWQRGHALAAARAGDVEAAVERLEAAARRWPAQEAEIRVDLGAVLEAAERPEDAEAQYRLAAEADPASPLPPFNLATLQAGRGELDDAVERLEQITGSHPGFAPAHRNLGVAYERQGRLEDAEAAYRREIEASPGHADGHAHLGFVLERRGDAQGAFDRYVRAVELEPDHAEALFHLADFLLARGRPAEAATYYREGLLGEPGNLQARYNWAKALLATGDAERAVVELQRVAGTRPGDPGPLLDLATGLEALGREEDARRVLEQARVLARDAGLGELVAALDERLQDF